jgi:hypothetical protein
MSDAPKLLSDRDVQQFIVNGYTIVQADYGPAFHEAVRTKIDGVIAEEGNLGNNILPRIPEIGNVFEHPNVKGALISLLGSDYVLNPHRHCHLNAAGSKGQKWHKDCYVYDHNLRHPRFDWVLAFYYPQDTTEDMGPSAILPATLHYKSISSPDAAETTEPDLKFCGPAGTVALIHFDSWHRASPNTSSKNRYMLKFQFARMASHTSPTWNHSSRDWSPEIADPQPNVSRDVWSWMCGDEPAIGHSEAGPGIEALTGGLEPDRLDASYRYVSRGGGVGRLAEVMRAQTVDVIGDATAKPADNLHGTNPTPPTAALAMSRAGKSAVPELLDLLRDDDWWIRAMAANVLYRAGDEAEDAVPVLTTAAGDDHWWVRRNALEALGEIAPSRSVIASGLTDPDYRVRRSACIGVAKGKEGDRETVQRLSVVLNDENRYNRFYAALALRRIDSEEARDALLDELFTARWCPITTKDDRF